MKFSTPRARFSRPRASRPASDLLEQLESRVLLSASHAGDRQILHPLFIRAAAAPSAVGSPVGLTPSQVRQAYGFNQVFFGSIVGDGSGQTIAIVDAYNAPTLVSDLHAFDLQFGLPDPVLTRINEHGGANLPGNDPSGPGDSWALETSLDVEWAHAMAPGAKIVLVEANSASDTDLFAAVNTARAYPGVSVVSMSWGGDEASSDLSRNATFSTPSGHTNISFVASSGDSGAFGSRGTRVVGYPAASPNVLSVGGTALTLSNNGSYLSETGWGDGSASFLDGGSGGGISRIESQPTYQHGIVTQTGTFRAVPDVAFLADPNTGVAVYDSYDSPGDPWIQIGGTSLAAPMWAGLISVINQGRALNGQNSLDGATDLLPKLYALPSSDFHDVTSGNNGFAAGPGFDLVTGRGTPIVNKLVADMVGTPLPSTPVPLVGLFSVNPAAVVSGTAITLTASNVAESSGNATVTSVAFYRETDGVDGLQPGSDLLLGNGIANGSTWTLPSDTDGFLAGSYTYYALATDSANATSIAVASLAIVSPTVGDLAAAPTRITVGDTFTLTASNVAEPAGGTIAGVNFYRESNGTPGLQSGSDTFVGVGTRVGAAWTLSVPTGGLDPGDYTFYAAGVDSAGIAGIETPVDVTISPPPAINNNFASALVITGTSATVTGSNVNATRESKEPALLKNRAGASIWWTWTAPASGRVSLDTSGSDFDTMLGVYTGAAVSSLKLVAANDDVSFFDQTSAVGFNAVAGITYHIRVDGYNADMGDVVMHLSELLPPANNSFAAAAVLFGNSISWTGSTIGATREAGEPQLPNNKGGASVWFSWTATQSGLVNINTSGSDFDTVMGVYSGSKLSALSLLAANDDANAFTLTSAVSFNAVAGTTYRIAVDGYAGSAGTLFLTLV